jgi:hypothetical protein
MYFHSSIYSLDKNKKETYFYFPEVFYYYLFVGTGNLKTIIRYATFLLIPETYQESWYKTLI